MTATTTITTIAMQQTIVMMATAPVCPFGAQPTFCADADPTSPPMP